jgi:pimeloyl-[acyl-carrier protein] methyl ester esterase
MKLDVTGQGPTLVYLHDWGFRGQSWGRQVEYFRPRFRNVVVDYNMDYIAPDRTHEGLFDDLCGSLLEALGPGDAAPLAVLAHGFGAFLAYELMERGLTPQRLVLMGGLVRFTNAEGYLSGLPPERVSVMRKALHEDPLEMVRRYYHFAFSGNGESTPDEVAQALPFQALDFLKLAFDTLISHDYAEVIPRLPCRALIVQGEDDRISPVWQGELLRKLLRDSTFYLCKGAGHAPFLTHYAAVNRRVDQFLEAQG